MAQATETESHGHFAGQSSDGAGGNRVYAALLLFAAVVKAVLLFREILAATARTHNDANAAQLIAAHRLRLQAGLFQRFAKARYRHRHRARNIPAAFGGYL